MQEKREGEKEMELSGGGTFYNTFLLPDLSTV